MIEDNSVILNGNYFEDETFSKISFEENCKIEDIEFQDCQFNNCKFSQVIFFDCRFENCTFKNCDLSSSSIKHSVFDFVLFTDSKLTGIQWAEAGIPLDVKLRYCNLSYSSFIGVDLKNTEMTNCILKEADFTEANLSKANFKYSDFSGARFIQTNLERTDLSHSINYAIHPHGNRLKKTIFSSPEVLSLLDVYDIIIK